MTLEQLLTATDLVPLDALTTIAAMRQCFGDDVEASFRTQIQLRQRAATAILDTASQRGDERGELLASEDRLYQRSMREADHILALLRQIEQRTGASYRVPESQTAVARTTEDETPSPVLTRDQKVSDYLTRRGGFAYQGERGALRFGAIVRALALGNRRGLSGLEARALSEGVDASGGYTVPEILAASFIDRVRNAMVVGAAGAQTVLMTSDTLHIARLAQPAAASPDIQTATWKVENADIDETDLLLERVTFTARTLPVLLKLSVELSEDSANIDDIVEREFSGQLALELDRAALLGSGVAPEPRGIVNQSGVGSTSFGSVDPADFDFICDSIGRVWASNHQPNARVYNSSLAVLLGKLKDSTNQPLRAPEMVTAVPQFITNQLPNSGTSPNTSTVIVGDFTQLMIGLRTSFRLEVTRVAGEAFQKLQVWVRAYLRADVQVSHPEAFDVVSDVGV